MGAPRKSIDDHFAKIQTVGSWWCWMLPNKLDQDGYVRIRIAGKKYRAHRAIYEHLIGPIPRGLVPDHLCRNMWCCNPNHLELVTDKVNILRGDGVAALNAQKTVCSNGHSLNQGNLYFNKHGYRICATCGRNRARTWARQNRT